MTQETNLPDEPDSVTSGTYHEVDANGKAWPGMRINPDKELPPEDQALVASNIVSIEEEETAANVAAREAKAQAEAKVIKDFENKLYSEVAGKRLIADIHKYFLLDGMIYAARIKSNAEHAWLQVQVESNYQEEGRAYRLENTETGGWRWGIYWLDPGKEDKLGQVLEIDFKRRPRTLACPHPSNSDVAFASLFALIGGEDRYYYPAEWESRRKRRFPYD